MSPSPGRAVSLSSSRIPNCLPVPGTNGSPRLQKCTGPLARSEDGRRIAGRDTCRQRSHIGRPHEAADSDGAGSHNRAASCTHFSGGRGKRSRPLRSRCGRRTEGRPCEPRAAPEGWCAGARAISGKFRSLVAEARSRRSSGSTVDGRGSSAGIGVASSFRQRRAARDLRPESRGVRPSSQRHGTASRRRNRSAVQCHVQHQTNTVCRMDVAAVRP